VRLLVALLFALPAGAAPVRAGTPHLQLRLEGLFGQPTTRLGARGGLLLEHRAKPGSKALLGFERGHPSTFRMFMTAGPSSTMNIAGKMNMTVGKSILIGAFIAFSSAAA